jgi:sulfide:quinone oxidoreductase
MAHEFDSTRRAFLAMAAAGGALAALPSDRCQGRHGGPPVQTNAKVVIIGAGRGGQRAGQSPAQPPAGCRHHHRRPARAAHLPARHDPCGGRSEARQIRHLADDGLDCPRACAFCPNTWPWSMVRRRPSPPKTARCSTTTSSCWPRASCSIMTRSRAFRSTWWGRTGSARSTPGPEYAARTWAAASHFVENGGRGIFTRPATEMKCAGAPLKHTFLIDDRLRRAGNRENAEVIYAAPQGSLFGVPIVAEKVRMLFGDRGIETQMERTLTAIDADRKIATFETADGAVEEGYDYLHVIPPQRAPDFVVQSACIGPTAGSGRAGPRWTPYTLRHLRDMTTSSPRATSPGCPRARRRRASSGRCRWWRITSSPQRRGARARPPTTATPPAR